MRHYLFLLFSFFLLGIFDGNSQVKENKPNSSASKIEISINTIDSTLKINNQILRTYNLDLIEKILGKPNRVEEHKSNSYIEEFPINKGESNTIIPIEVTNYYYIYDQLGLVFYTKNGEFPTKEPTQFIIYFINKRTFTNSKEQPFSPKNYFTGLLCVNGDTINPIVNLVPKKTTYNTKLIDLFHTQFSPTSFATIIDSFYSYKSIPHIQIFLDGKETQRVSYILVF